MDTSVNYVEHAETCKVFNNVSKRKRRFSETNEQTSAISSESTIVNNVVNSPPAAKYREVETDYRFTLDHFCDEILYEIFKYLGSQDLLTMKRICRRFNELVYDKRFWRYISLLESRDSYNQLLESLQFTHAITKCLKLRGPSQKSLNYKSSGEIFNKTLSKSLTSNCTQLEILELYSICLDLTLLHFKHIPQSLQRLVINDCDVLNLSYQRSSWLSGIHTHLVNLQRLDLRQIPLTDTDLQCFNVIETLREVMLECPPYINTAKGFNVSLSASKGYGLGECAEATTGEYNSSGTSSSQAAQSSSSTNDFWASLNKKSPQRRQQANPDHIIYIDLRNPQGALISVNNIPGVNPRAVSMGQAQGQEEGGISEVNRVIRHDLFWDLINPLRRGASNFANADNATTVNVVERQDEFPTSSGSVKQLTYPRNFISDQGLCSFGRSVNPTNHGRIWIGIRNRPNDTLIERFTIRNYKNITDVFLRHIVQCSPNLLYLDISGTGITFEGVKIFKESKPECKIVAEHLLGLNDL
uniref:F-box domain-containing protein n=1 Tax=Glossina austeni TaxID=7395 RepID=A0A1A9ULX8_GLOAU